MALALVAIIGLVFITLFYSLIESGGGLFGTLNDVCVALGGILRTIQLCIGLPFREVSRNTELSQAGSWRSVYWRLPESWLAQIR